MFCPRGAACVSCSTSSTTAALADVLLSLPHHECVEGLRTAQPRRSTARVGATSGAVAPSSERRSRHHVHHSSWQPLKVRERATQKRRQSVRTLLLLFGTPLNACVCTLRITRACKLTANFHPCRPGDVGLRSPEINLTQSWDEQDCPPNHADCIASSCNQHKKYQCTQNNANLFHTRGRACTLKPTRCAGVFLFSRIRFLPGH